ncbi:MAG: hypothetical protein R3C69_18740 [Geminicoccaceae bacterium]
MIGVGEGGRLSALTTVSALSWPPLMSSAAAEMPAGMEVDMPALQRREAGTFAVERHGGDLVRGDGVEQGRHDIRQAAGASRRHLDLARPGTGVRDQLLEGLRGRIGPHDHHGDAAARRC